jgi:CspA family cold shock protein
MGRNRNDPVRQDEVRERPGHSGAGRDPVTGRDQGESTGRHRGKVKRLVRDKGFGFISSDTDGKEYFFHRSALSGSDYDELIEGDTVEFAGLLTPKGPRAASVERN